VVDTEQSLGGDSFAWYLERIPGSYARLGVHDPRTSAQRLDLHASTFDVDERAIDVGVRVLVTTALDALTAAGR
jgi:amidohydrolase